MCTGRTGTTIDAVNAVSRLPSNPTAEGALDG